MSYRKYWGWALWPNSRSRIECVRDTEEEAVAWLITEVITRPGTRGVVVLLESGPMTDMMRKREVVRRVPHDALAWWEDKDGPAFDYGEGLTVYGRMVDPVTGKAAGGCHGKAQDLLLATMFLMDKEATSGKRAEATVVDSRRGWQGDGPPGEVMLRWNNGKAWWE